MMEQSFGFNLAKSIIVGITFFSQFVLLFTTQEAPTPYLIANLSIILGYILDILLLMGVYSTLKKFAVFTLCSNAIAIVIAFGDILAINTYTVSNFYFELITKSIIPGLTLISLGLYFTLCMFIAVKIYKE